ncbi:hypothetical protein PINS_up010246 [Pythium insidiosum]|nr:hypothetical protein PINS_up010246 [Pythium insidiosum]
MAVDVVHLKRKIQNPSSELLEWRRCVCSVTGDGQLVLELLEEDEEEDDDKQKEGEEEEEEEIDVPRRLTLDLSWQLVSLEQKRKCKTRCELRYLVVDASDSDAARAPYSPSRQRCEELMAPSPHHCQQWIELVRDAERRAKRRRSMRLGTELAATMSAAIAPATTAAAVTATPSVASTRSHNDDVEPSMMSASRSSSGGSGIVVVIDAWRAAAQDTGAASPEQHDVGVVGGVFIVCDERCYCCCCFSCGTSRSRSSCGAQ